MRLLNSVKNDIRFQIKYGFYFLYAFFTIVYMALLMLIPSEYKNLAASLIILTDPAMLGIFFMGGLWLLEKGEGLHRFWSISPLRPMEYVLSKSVSLAILSVLSADFIALIGLGPQVHLGYLSLGIFIGAVVFNFIGLMVASYARTVNHYMLIVVPPTIILSIPPVFTAFGWTHPLLEVFPGTALWHMIMDAMNMAGQPRGFSILILIFWLGLLLFLANKRIGTALQSEGGEGA